MNLKYVSRIGRCLLFYLLGSLFVFPLAKAGEAPNRKTEIADYKALHFECKQRPYAFGLRLQCEEKQGKYSYEFRLRGKPLIDIYANQSYQSNLRSEFSIKCHISDYQAKGFDQVVPLGLLRLKKGFASEEISYWAREQHIVFEGTFNNQKSDQKNETKPDTISCGLEKKTDAPTLSWSNARRWMKVIQARNWSDIDIDVYDMLDGYYLPRFDYSGEEIEHRCRRDLELANIAIDSLSKKSWFWAKADFANTIVPFQELLADLMDEIYTMAILSKVGSDQTIVDNALSCDGTYDAFVRDLRTREKLYKKLATALDQTHFETLKAEDKKIYAFFKDQLTRWDAKLQDGVALLRLRNLYEKRGDLSKTFQSQVKIASDSDILFSESDFEGVSDSILQELRRSDFIPELRLYPYIMTYAQSEQTRKDILFLSKRYGVNFSKNIDNRDVLVDLLNTRRQIAQILGYEHFADLELASQAVKSYENLNVFLGKFSQATRPLIEKEKAELEALKQQSGSIGPLKEHDVFYYENLLQKKSQIDESALSRMFPLQNVIRILTEEIFRDYVDFRFELQKDTPIQPWHSEVNIYKVFDRDEKDQWGKDRLVAYVYLDFFARSFKYQQGVSANFIQRERDENGITVAPAHILVSFPFSKPEGPEDQYYLEYGVSQKKSLHVLLHEFGHVLHYLSGKSSSRYFSTYHHFFRPLDFVETPAKFNELLLLNYDFLKLLSDGAFPRDLFNQIVQYKKGRGGFFNGGQLAMAWSMLNLDAQTTRLKVEDIQNIWDSTHKLAYFEPPQDTYRYASFRFLANGYEAKYYSYFWADVMAYDLYSKIAQNGLSELKKYRNVVLSPPRHENPIEIMTKFLGREPKVDTYFNATSQ